MALTPTGVFLPSLAGALVKERKPCDVRPQGLSC